MFLSLDNGATAAEHERIAARTRFTPSLDLTEGVFSNRVHFVLFWYAGGVIRIFSSTEKPGQRNGRHAAVPPSDELHVVRQLVFFVGRRGFSGPLEHWRYSDDLRLPRLGLPLRSISSCRSYAKSAAAAATLSSSLSRRIPWRVCPRFLQILLCSHQRLFKQIRGRASALECQGELNALTQGRQRLPVRQNGVQPAEIGILRLNDRGFLFALAPVHPNQQFSQIVFLLRRHRILRFVAGGSQIQKLAYAWIWEARIEMRKGEMSTPTIIAAERAQPFRLFDHHQSAVQPTNRIVCVANLLGYLVQRLTIASVNIGDVLRFRVATPLRRPVHVFEAKVAPSVLPCTQQPRDSGERFSAFGADPGYAGVEVSP